VPALAQTVDHGGIVEYRRRVIDGLLTDRLAASGAILLEGPKASGKTFTAEQHAKSYVYLDTDEAVRQALQVDPSLVLNGEPPQLIDEWQLDGTHVWNYVRAEVNRRKQAGQFILTGSSVPDDDIRRHSGAGRFARLIMRTMSLFESGESSGEMSLSALLAGDRPTASPLSLTARDIAELIVRGGWPLNLGKSSSASSRVNIDYLKTIVEVDVPRIGGARRDPASALRLAQALARNVAMEQKVTRLASEVAGDNEGLARTTVYDHLRIFERLMVIEAQPPWAVHLRSRATLLKASRTHFTDPSLAAAALQADAGRLVKDLNYLGLLFESLVVRDSRVYASPLDGTVYHYRDSDGLEVDVIIQTADGRWGAFEVKLGIAQVEEAAAKLLTFASKVDTTKSGDPSVLGVITSSGYGYTRPDGIVVVPIGSFGP
jgi:predicted AAA+ superfamily ATPase